MNEQMITLIERELGLPPAPPLPLVKDVAPHHIKAPQRTIAEMTAAVDRDDLGTQTANYRDILHMEYSICADQLRHRADMMRRRANEFEEIADHMEKIVTDLNNKVTDAAKVHQDTLKILADHAHIRPTRVDNSGG